MGQKLTQLGLLAAILVCLVQAEVISIDWGKLNIEWPPHIVTPAPGPRKIVVLRETEVVDRGLTEAVFALRNAADAAPPGTRLYILDDDDPGAARFAAKLAGVPSPSLLVLAGDRVLFAGPCPRNAADLLAEVKKHADL